MNKEIGDRGSLSRVEIVVSRNRSGTEFVSGNRNVASSDSHVMISTELDCALRKLQELRKSGLHY